MEKSSMVQYLPGIYRESAPEEKEFLYRFLRPFEDVLLDSDVAGLENKIAHISNFFDADKTPEPFLPWLAGWVALTLRADLDEATKRALIGEIVPLYARRGTKNGLQRFLEIILQTAGAVVVINEPTRPPLQIGKICRLGKDAYIGGGPPHFFEVILHWPQSLSVEERRRLRRLARAVIDQEKPAHTLYSLTDVEGLDETASVISSSDRGLDEPKEV